MSPTDSGFTCSTAFQNASTVWAEIIVSPPRPTAAEIITGSSRPSSAKTSWIATRAALAFSESKMVSTSRTSLPPAMRARTCRTYVALTWSKVTTRKPGSSASGEFESDTVSGPIAPATKRCRPSALATRSAHSRHCRADSSLISQASPSRKGSSMIF